ncbi:MAG: hypothetical protein JWN52_1891 [Actinomycetia bacterium]|nr:hypothetical protein [Actinomycetes bacterium]
MNDAQEHGGPARNDEATEQLARDLYEQVRHLNYATGGPPGLTRPSTAYTVLGNLSAAAHGIAQTLTQLDRFLHHELAAGRLGHDQGEDLNAAIHACGQALAGARNDARALSKTTGDAQNAINAVHGPLSPAVGKASPSQLTSEPRAPKQPPRTAGDLAAESFPVPIAEALHASPGSDPAPGEHLPAPQARTSRKGL